MIPREKLALVKGFASPIFVGFDERGKHINGFTDPADVERIEKGYGCGYCAAIFHTFQLQCPICGRFTNVEGVRQTAPEEWQRHVDTRHRDIPTLGPGERREIEHDVPMIPRSPDEFLAALAKDKDVDQVPLSRLKPPKWGRGKPK